MAYNPCFCWNLKDGCVTVAIWTLVYSIIQLSIFSWQSYVIKYERDKFANRRSSLIYGTVDSIDYRYQGVDWTKFYVDPAEQFFTGLFVIQILCLISAFFLLFASVALMYGIHTNSKHLIWPWFPCIAASILCSMAYCVTWWVWGVENYWLILTIIECFSVLVNCYAVNCIVVQYRRVLSGVDSCNEDLKVPVVVWDDHNENANFTETKWGPKAYWNKTFEEEPKQANKRSLYAQGLSDFGAAGATTKASKQSASSLRFMQQQQQQQTPVLQQYQAEPRLRTFDQQKPNMLSQIDSEETIPVETVFQGPKAGEKLPRDIYSPKVKPSDLMERSRSVDALTAKLEEQLTEKKMRISRSKDSLTSRHRHRSHSRHKHDSYDDDDTYDDRSLENSRLRMTDTDTGYSETPRSRRRHGHLSSDEGEQSHHRHRRHRRSRSQKREEKDRGDKKPSTTSTPSTQPYPYGVAALQPLGLSIYPAGYPMMHNIATFAGGGEVPPGMATHLTPFVSSYPVTQGFGYPGIPASAAAAQQLPAHSGTQIVPHTTSQIVPTQRQTFVAGQSQQQQQPQQVQINSEILISYNDQATPNSRPESRHSTVHSQPSVTANPASLIAAIESDLEGRTPSASGSVDSKCTRATAV